MTKNKIFLTAEIGINHNGSIDVAKKLIDLAKECKCDAVKFQKRNPDICVPENRKYDKRDTPWGYIPYIEYRKKVEFGKKEYDIIDEYCKEIKIDWYASAWDVDSQVFIDGYNLNYNKLGSPMLTNANLLKHVAKQGKKTFISTGMSTWDEIDVAVNTFIENKCPYVVLHCVSQYPCPSDKLNLKMIKILKDRYECEIGYSSHFKGIVDVPIAVSMGATYIEKHITLDRTMWGTDHASSLERSGLEYISRDSKIVKGMLGNGKRKLTDEEIKNKERLRKYD